MGGKSTKLLRALDISNPLSIQQVMLIWNRFDTNRSGYLEKEQADAFVESWCKANGIVDAEQVAKVRSLFWEHYDVVGDGRIARWEIMNEKAAGVDEEKFQCVFCTKQIPLSWLRLPCAAREQAIKNIDLDLLANKQLEETVQDDLGVRQVLEERRQLEDTKNLWSRWESGHMPLPEHWKTAKEMLEFADCEGRQQGRGSPVPSPVGAAAQSTRKQSWGGSNPALSPRGQPNPEVDMVNSLQQKIIVLEERVRSLERENAALAQQLAS